MSNDESPVALPDFDLVANLLIEEGVLAVSPAELHGLLAGQLAAGARFDADTLLKVFQELMDVSALRSETTKLGLIELYQRTLAQYESDDFGFALLLPDDDQMLAQRAEALGSWCSGFLSGFGLHTKANTKLSQEASEGLQDLAQIAQIAADTDAESEEDEADLMEVQEYVRMAAMLMFNECNRVPESDAEAKPPTLH
ncbi:MAG: hypothetical protein CMI01_11380 [Oceanospirillaceae bacterium]|jgi:uncharacterized protein YgfB (UPF0149 family)|uniref:UPF0149 family protein n=1 Tax=Marinobacterium litorale TaxID=404770 RepID=UPI000401080B|nr:UPF0149 family protein [Marinobacterium litorale]MBS99266.1 hypothetical protein [Oceanospirillaceae bacterium]